MLLKAIAAMILLVSVLCAIAAVLPTYGTPLMGLILTLAAACLFGALFEWIDHSEKDYDNEE